jgi:hypothetical protein
MKNKNDTKRIKPQKRLNTKWSPKYIIVTCDSAQIICPLASGLHTTVEVAKNAPPCLQGKPIVKICPNPN